MNTAVHITYDQLLEMLEKGFMADSEERFELLSGEIRLMTLPKPPHNFLVDELNEWSFEVLTPGTVRIRVQSPVGIPELDSMVLPDVAWLKRIDYSIRHPLSEDVLLMIEVADSTLSKDRRRKGKIYASAGIADFWIVNVAKRRLEIRRDPQGGTYRTVLTLKPGEEARPLAFPDVSLPVSRLFPDRDPN